MPVVREDLLDANPTHDNEGDVIDDAGLGCLPTVVGCPGILDFLGRRFNQESFLNQLLPEPIDMGTKRTPGSRISALPTEPAGWSASAWSVAASPETPPA